VNCDPLNGVGAFTRTYVSLSLRQPKGVVRDNGGHAVALKWSMSNIMNTHQGETFWAASDIGWAVGHSYIVYGPLIQGCTVRRP
jgi:propionyl-CoA synthetase